MLLQLLEDTYRKWWHDRIQHANDIYDIVSHLLDTNFISAFNKDTDRMYERWRELYLWNTLNKQYNLLSTQTWFPQWAPDFCIEDKGSWHRIWIECAFSSDWSWSNRVPEFWSTTEIADWDIPRILRITSSLQEKLKKFNLYKKNWLIEDDDECYIAINSNFDNMRSEPIITWACYGRWLTQFLRWSGGELHWLYYQARDRVVNNNQSEIVTNTLLDDEYRIINGVIYYSDNFMQMISNDLNYQGNEFYILENPHTISTLRLINEVRITYDLLNQTIKYN
jgi:hypothetical protein